MSGDLTTLFLGIGGIFGAFALIAFASKSYSLNGIKGRTVGDGQHGTDPVLLSVDQHKSYLIKDVGVVFEDFHFSPHSYQR